MQRDVMVERSRPATPPPAPQKPPAPNAEPKPETTWVYVPAGFGPRLIAFLIDTTLTLLLLYVGFLFLSDGRGVLAAWGLASAFAIATTLIYGYFSIVIIGSTLGMLATNSKVVKVDGRKVDLISNIPRTLVYFSSTLLPLIVLGGAVAIPAYIASTANWTALSSDSALLFRDPGMVFPSLSALFDSLAGNSAQLNVVDLDEVAAEISASAPGLQGLGDGIKYVGEVLNTQLVQSFVNAFAVYGVAIVCTVLGLFALILCLPMLVFNLVATAFGDTKRSIHDLAAGTMVARYKKVKLPSGTNAPAKQTH